MDSKAEKHPESNSFVWYTEETTLVQQFPAGDYWWGQ